MLYDECQQEINLRKASEDYFDDLEGKKKFYAYAKTRLIDDSLWLTPKLSKSELSSKLLTSDAANFEAGIAKEGVQLVSSTGKTKDKTEESNFYEDIKMPAVINPMSGMIVGTKVGRLNYSFQVISN